MHSRQLVKGIKYTRTVHIYKIPLPPPPLHRSSGKAARPFVLKISQMKVECLMQKVRPELFMRVAGGTGRKLFYMKIKISFSARFLSTK
jgi:hypothetical protein